jgi:NADPH:quinone reductase-like Zn-dependent oxidoreductase
MSCRLVLPQPEYVTVIPVTLREAPGHHYRASRRRPSRGGGDERGEGTMRAAGIPAYGDEVRPLDVPAPRPPRADEVLLRVQAAAVGNWDEIVRSGGWDVGHAAGPKVLGVAAAGVVLAAGDGVSGLRAGDEVITHPVPLRAQGTWAEQLIAAAGQVARKPAGVPWEAAAALVVPALTAQQVLVRALQLRAGETVLVHGAGGVTGGLLVQLAALCGARVIATAGPASAARVGSLGASHVLDYHDPGWPARARELAGSAGIAAAVSAVPGGAVQALPVIAAGGRLATITSDPPVGAPGISFAQVYVAADAAQLHALARLADRGQLTLRVAATYPLPDAAAALAHVLRGASGGAVVLRP